MINEIIKDLALQDRVTPFNDDEWLNFSNVAKDLVINYRTFSKAIAAHSGVPIPQVQETLASLTKASLSPEEKKQNLAALQKAQKDATCKISTFQQRRIFNYIGVDSLSLSRTEWNTIITRFEQQQKKHLTLSFLLATLSTIKKINFVNLNAILSKAQPERQINKRKRLLEHEASVKRAYRPYSDDDGVNPFIFENVTNNFDLEDKLEATGVRVTTRLSHATPEKGYHNVMQTPGGTKVRPVCKVSEYTFFKHLTPVKYRDNVLEASQKHIAEVLPKLRVGRAEPVEYIATLESILERHETGRRQTQRSLTGASAADVFKAHGVAIIPAQSRSKHWAHLIAHFLGDPQDIISEDPEQEVINLIPSTAEANYNTLEAVELFIKKKLVSRNANEIHIHVKPVYSGESLIPDSLVYTLNWSDVGQKNHKEVFYINPQSHFRLSKSTHQSIAVLRETRNITSAFKMDADDSNESNVMRI